MTFFYLFCTNNINMEPYHRNFWKYKCDVHTLWIRYNIGLLYTVFRIRSVSDRIRIRIPVLKKTGSGSRISDPDPGSGSFKFCESISLEYAVVICRFIGKRACQTWFYSVKNILSTWSWFSTHPIISFNKKYNSKLILLRIFVGIRIRIPTCQNTRIRNTASNTSSNPLFTSLL